jgi:precorrin-2 dehydrogenase/sirohydrochlorin ferrochelatase
MLPLSLDVARLPVALVGRGAPAARRLALLDQAGAGALVVFSDQPSVELAARAGDRLRRRLPAAGDLAGRRLVMIAGLPDGVAEAVAEAATAAGALVNVEDAAALCDVHMPAIVRRGALTLAISTGGLSPGLAQLIKHALEPLIDARWGEWLGDLAARRARWRAAGLAMAEVAHRTAAFGREKGWLTRLEPSPFPRGFAARAPSLSRNAGEGGERASAREPGEGLRL